jgi:hypothetical protein
MRRRFILRLPTLRGFHVLSLMLFSLCLLPPVCAQESPVAAAAQSAQPVESSLRELREEVRELRAAVAEMRTETARYREEAIQMRRELEAAQVLPENSQPAAYEISAAPAPVKAEMSAAKQEAGDRSVSNIAVQSESAAPNPASIEARAAKLEEEYQLLSGKTDEQYQSKVESASKYRMRLSGIVLFNLFSNKGAVENQDFPSVALPVPPGNASGSVGATLRQSQLGLEVFGPRLAGARTSADVQLDFAGGFQNTWNGVNSGLVRLRTATVRFDWAKTSIVAGQDGLFFSPLTPTSFASLAVPALTYAGNLWSWTPQIRIEHRFVISEGSSLLVQGGILDNLNGDFPANPNFRFPEEGELSRQPGYGSRAAWSQTVFGQKLTIAGAGYYGPQNYGFGRTVNGWAGMSDWNLPLGHLFTLSGKFYRGRAVGGLGATIGTSAVYNGDPSLPATAIIPLNGMGGWSQLKFRPNSKLEFNTAFGQDGAFARDVRLVTVPQDYFGSVVRNRSFLANTIFRPRSDLLFSAEFRHLSSTALYNNNHNASQVNLTMGVLF